jgi:hypothetical protein
MYINILNQLIDLKNYIERNLVVVHFLLSFYRNTTRQEEVNDPKRAQAIGTNTAAPLFFACALSMTRQEEVNDPKRAQAIGTNTAAPLFFACALFTYFLPVIIHRIHRGCRLRPFYQNSLGAEQQRGKKK